MVGILSTRVDLSFSAHKLEKFPENPGKLHFEGLVHLLRYIKYNKTLGLKYYSEMKYSPLSGLLIQSSIKTDNQFMGLSDFVCKDCPDTGRIKGAYMIFYQGVSIYYCTPVPVPVDQLSAES